MKKIDVLYIDDDKSLTEFVIDELTHENITAIAAHNKKNAKCCIDQYKPRVIILDIMMPSFNGLEFLKELKKKKIDSYIIMYSSIDNSDIQIKSLDLNAHYFVSKNDELTVLVSKVKRLLREYKQYEVIYITNNTSFQISTSTLSVHNENFILQPTSLKILDELHQNVNIYISMDYLCTKLDINTTKSLQNHISKLRNCLKQDNDVNIMYNESGYMLCLELN